MNRYSKWNMWTHLAVPMSAVLLAGVLAVSIVMVQAHYRDSRKQFVESVQLQAAFIRDMSLPTSARMAQNLGAVFGFKVYFVSPENGLIPNPDHGSGLLRNKMLNIPENTVQDLIDGQYEAVKSRIEGNTSILVIRQKQEYINRSSLGNVSLVAGLFLITALLLGWLLTRRLVRPLKVLAELIGHFDGDAELERPACTARRDEIGLLARALLDTRERLLKERIRRKKAERKAALMRITGSLAHEIRNPVAAVQMHLQLLETTSDNEMADKVKSVLPVVRRELKRIEKMLNQWMYLVNPNPSVRRTCDIGQLIHESIQSHTPMAEHAAVDIVFHEGYGVNASVDMMRISMVLDNLVRNGIQAMPDGGGLHIDCKHDGNTIHVCIWDEGHGFSDDALKNATDLFFTEKEGGMGVGLSVCRAIVEAHGGRFQWGNRDDDAGRKHLGAEIHFWLPVEETSGSVVDE